MTGQTRKLTGKPPWPIVLLAGAEKTGKTWAAVKASTSDLIGNTLWFPMGENDPDEYGLIPGFDSARFDLVEHDGTYRGLRDELAHHLRAERAAKGGGKPTLWVLDSGTRLWDLLSNMAQLEMWARLAKKAQQANRPVPDIEQKPSVDLWNTAGDRWGHIFDALREHNGPVIITARMELKTVMSPSGEPTKDKAQKILAQKSLPFDVDAIVEMPALGETYLSGVRSVKLASLEPRVVFKDFTVDLLWRRLGLADAPVGQRTHSTIDPADKPAAEADVARVELGALCEERGWRKEDVAALWFTQADSKLSDCANAAAIRAFADELKTNGLPGEKAA